MSEKRLPLGIQHNNYLNVKNDPADPWQDEGGRVARSDSKGHAVFTNPAYGVRAGILTLRSYYFKHKLRTVAEIIARWAPASDTEGSLEGGRPNRPNVYAGFVARRMGITIDERLNLFNPDKSVGDAKQLRALFYAMAENELGLKDAVPAEVFEAGLALARGETVDAAATVGGGPAGELALTPPGAAPTPPGGPAAAPPEGGGATPGAAEPDEEGAAPELKIGGSVGNWDKGANNAEDDVETVQEMLRQASMIMDYQGIDPGDIDGEIAQVVEDSATVGAIIAFQRLFMNYPDGLIEVGGRTWRELVSVLEGTSRLELKTGQPGDRPKHCFPFAELPNVDWTGGFRGFGSRRDKGRRAHAACDLYYPTGTTIHAVADGKVVRGPYHFYLNTYALEIDHGDFLARYGEVRPATSVKEGDRVEAGQPIAKVGRLNMLHLELYDKTATGPLTVDRAASRLGPQGRPFYRRRDLIDPTQRLNEWKHNLPGRYVAPQGVAAVSASAATTTASAKIPATGFCIHIKRTRQERRASMGYPRTVGEYQCYWNGAPIEELKGQMVERGGPGDNTAAVGNERDLRVDEGAYRLSIHEGTRYKTYGYQEQPRNFRRRPNPGLLLLDTRERKYILIHPGEDYVWSVGCLNPTSGLTSAQSAINFGQSRARVVAMIEAMKSRLGNKFPRSGVIPDALIVIEGEPV